MKCCVCNEDILQEEKTVEVGDDLAHAECEAEGEDAEGVAAIQVKDIRAAIAGLDDDAPLNLRLLGAPDGLAVEFCGVLQEGGRLLITGEAFFTGEGGAD
jgi:hypothetical protein